MIRPRAGVAFSLVAQGDQRHDPVARASFAAELGVPSEWAVLRQVHGKQVVEVEEPGEFGDADALFTRQPGLPIAVFTADCAGVVLGATGAVGVAHAGWRGADAGVVAALATAMAEAGAVPRWAAIGPAIGPCCFEVGPEVAARFPEDGSMTTWGTVSVDLVGALERQLGNLELWRAGICTFDNSGCYSHRRDSALERMATVAWLPG